MRYILFIIVFATLIFSSCTKDEIIPSSTYFTNLSFPDSSQLHPNHLNFQQALDDFKNSGGLGGSIMIRDAHGTWLGATGQADIISDVDMEVGHQFLIASISKVFTATAIFSYIDEGKLSVDDQISQYLSAEIVDKVANADQATIGDLLSHRSGIADWYTIALEMARYNEEFNNFSQEDILSYVYGKSAFFEVGEAYGYSNTNYVLLGIILENISNLSLKQVYHQKIFDPLNLESAYFDIKENGAPKGLVKGYISLYGNGYTEADALYKDELSTGDGGIAINAQDLGVFMDALMDGQLVSQSSLQQMQAWFDFDEGEGHIKNGFGLEYFNFENGVAIGHTGSVDGFSSILYYYPEQDVLIVGLFNYSPGSVEEYEKLLQLEKDINQYIFE